MNKKFQRIKIFIIFTIMLLSPLFVFCPIASSLPLDPIYECEPIFVVDYNKTLLQEPITPLAEARVIPIQIKVRIAGPAVDIVVKYTNADIYLRPSIEEVPEGCHASVNPPLLKVPLSTELSTEFVSFNATVSIVVDQKLPALTEEHIIIRLKSDRLGASATVVKAANITQIVPFTIGYYPQLDVTYPDGNVKDIRPDETVSFPVKIHNLANGNTEVTFEVTDMPKGWIAEIITSTTLGTDVLGGNSNKTIYLKIKPPMDFGYHEDRGIIRVSLTPSYYNNPKFKGEPLDLYFIVQSRGFSTPGFEIITLLFAFIFVLFPIWKRKNSKIEKKQSRGGKE